MIKYKYNNTILPVLPEGSENLFSCITYSSDYDKYFLIQSEYPIIYAADFLRFHTDYNFRMYSSLINSAGWNQETVSVTPGYWWTLQDIMSLSQLIWSSESIIDLEKSTDEKIVYVYEGTTPEEVTAANPPQIYFAGWSEAGKLYPSSSIQKIVLRQGRKLIGHLVIIAYNDDGGTIDFDWKIQKTGQGVESIEPFEETSIESGTEGIYGFGSKLLPPNDEVGGYDIACFANNHLNDTVTANGFGIHFEVIEDQTGFDQQSFSYGFGAGIKAKEEENAGFQLV